MSDWNAKIGGYGPDGCSCAVKVGMCPVHHPKEVAAWKAQLFKEMGRSIAAAKGWQTRRRNARRKQRKTKR